MYMLPDGPKLSPYVRLVSELDPAGAHHKPFPAIVSYELGEGEVL